MSDEPLRWMSLEVDRWLADTVTLTPLEYMVLHRLLAHQWRNGGAISGQISVLARLAGVELEDMKKALPALSPWFRATEGGKVVNDALEAERQRALNIREARRRGAELTNRRSNRAERTAERAAERTAERTAERGAERVAPGGRSVTPTLAPTLALAPEPALAHARTLPPKSSESARVSENGIKTPVSETETETEPQLPPRVIATIATAAPGEPAAELARRLSTGDFKVSAREVEAVRTRIRSMSGGKATQPRQGA